MVDISKYSKLISKTAYTKMAADNDDEIREFVARNCHIAEILETLAGDDEYDVREAAFDHIQNIDDKDDLSASDLLDAAGYADADVKEWVITKLKEQIEKGVI